VRVQAAAARLRTKLQQLAQTVTQTADGRRPTADGRLSIAAFRVNLTDRQRERIRSLVLRIDLPPPRPIHTAITGRRDERHWGALRVDQQQAATELIAAGVIATYDDELMPSRRLEAAIDNFQLQRLR